MFGLLSRPFRRFFPAPRPIQTVLTELPDSNTDSDGVPPGLDRSLTGWKGPFRFLFNGETVERDIHVLFASVEMLVLIDRVKDITTGTKRIFVLDRKTMNAFLPISEPAIGTKGIITFTGQFFANVEMGKITLKRPAQVVFSSNEVIVAYDAVNMNIYVIDLVQQLSLGCRMNATFVPSHQNLCTAGNA